MSNTNHQSQNQMETPTATAKPSEFWTVFLLGLFLGVFGIHRFYARKFKSGIVQLVTFGGLGIWTFIDVITILLSKFKNSNGVVFTNPKPKVAWGIFAAVCILGIISKANDKETGSGGSGGSSSSHSSSHKSARSLIQDYARSHYGKIESIDIDNYTDGSYQVKIYSSSGYQDTGYKTATYKVSVDESAQEVTSWRYVGE